MVKAPSVILCPFPPNSNETTNTTKLQSISLLPFQISYDGLAPISTYFSTRTRISTSKSLNTELNQNIPLLESSFRGRQVLSTPIDLPKGFTGLIFSTTTPTMVTTSDDRSGNSTSRKRVKLTSTAEVIYEGKGKGKEKEKEIVLSSITGRRTSPRKKVAVVKYSMDTDEEEEEEEKEEVVIKGERVDEMKHEEEGQVHIEITAPTSPMRSPSPSSSTTLSAHPSISSVFSLADTLAESQSSQENLEEDEEEAQVKDIQELIPFATFGAIQIWNSDYELDGQEDVFVRSLTEWVGVGNKIHAY